MTKTKTSPTRNEIDTGPTAAWMKPARGAAITMAAWSVILQAIAGELIPPVLVVGLVFLAFAPFLSGDRPRLGLVFAVATTVLMAGNAPFLIDDLSNPESAATFVLGLLSFLAGLVAIVSGLAAWRRLDPSSTGRIAVGAASVFVVGAVLSLIAARATESDPARLGDFEMSASGVEWSTDLVEVDAGGGLWIDNEDGIRHTFGVESEGFEFEIPALKSRRSDIGLAPGAYAFVCTVPGHEGMTGTLVVRG